MEETSMLRHLVWTTFRKNDIWPKWHLLCFNCRL